MGQKTTTNCEETANRNRNYCSAQLGSPDSCCMYFKMINKPQVLTDNEALLLRYLDERDFPVVQNDEKWICMEQTDWHAIRDSNNADNE